MNKTTKRATGVLRVAAVVLGGAAAWIALSSSQAGAITLVDQDSDTTNAGAAVANTGGNIAVGNASDSDASVDQDATANNAKDDAVAVNTASANNASNGSATISTGDADATGNQSSTSHSQTADVDGSGIAIIDQDSDTTNAGIAGANTGGNIAVGNASDSDADVDQDATANNAGGDGIAVNLADVVNNSNGSASIVTGDASAVGNRSSTSVVQVADAADTSLLVVDQDHSTSNLGLALANSGFNIVVGNASTNNTVDVDQDATANNPDGDSVAVNDTSAVNNATGSAAIATGKAWAIGNQSSDATIQVIDGDGVRATRAGSNPAIPLALALAFLLLGTPARRLAMRRY